MKKILFVHILVLIMLSTNAQIYQFRGPNRDGKFPENETFERVARRRPLSYCWNLRVLVKGIPPSFQTGSISMPPERLKTWII